jgi:hypothetical protein
MEINDEIEEKFSLPFGKYLQYNETNNQVDYGYDIDSEDEMFLEDFNKNQQVALTEMEFERIISLIEEQCKMKVRYFLIIRMEKSQLKH